MHDCNLSTYEVKAGEDCYDSEATRGYLVSSSQTIIESKSVSKQ